MKESFDIPVIFFIFNRADTTRLVFEQIRRLRPRKLYIFADGPRIGRNETDICQETRKATENIDWDCEVIRKFSDDNLGCRESIASGISSVFSKEEMAIILEDDCLPDSTFFEYCKELLIKYKDDSRIGAISGDNFQFGKYVPSDSYYFSRYFNCWGWATWKRSWLKYDKNLSTWPEIKSKKLLKNIFSKNYQLYFWNEIFDRVHEKKINTWDHQFTLSLFLQNSLTIIPKVNLVKNIGFDERGTHTHAKDALAEIETAPLTFPLMHPQYIYINKIADENTENICFYSDSAIINCKIILKKLIGTNMFLKIKKLLRRTI